MSATPESELPNEISQVSQVSQVSELTRRVDALALAVLREEGLGGATSAIDSASIRLLGADAVCDSVSLVGYLVALEERVNREFKSGVALLDEGAMSQTRSPFRTVSTLVSFVVGQLVKAGVSASR